MTSDIFSMKSLSHLSHNHYLYRRMVHEEDVIPPNKKTHMLIILALLTTDVNLAY